VTSLARQLKLWLLPMFLAAAIVAASTTYFVFGAAVNWFMDSQLVGIAEAHAVQAPAAVQRITPHELEKGRLLVQIFFPTGELLATACPEAKLGLVPSAGFHDVPGDNGGWRVYVLPLGERTIQAAQPLAMRRHIVRDQVLQSGLPVALLIPLSAVVLWITIRLALRPLETVAAAAAARNEHDLSALPTDKVPREVLPLVLSMNRLLVRLNDAFAGQRRFVQDAAHELRTPITALSLQLDNLKARVTDREAAAQVAQLEAGLGRTKRLVEQLLRLARQEAPLDRQRSSVLVLGAFIREVIAEMLPLADKRRIDMGLSEGAAIEANANADDLRSLLHNLLDNAIRYTPQAGVVDVELRREGERAVIQIADTGPGVPAEVLPRLFDRFFRVEGTETEGSGLGLAIAKRAAERNGWQLTIANRAERAGLIARIELPARAARTPGPDLHAERGDRIPTEVETSA
jgi:two-component system, OmpR family, sensor kinase